MLSASFIPVYVRLEAQGRHLEARKVAGAVAGLLALAIALLVAVGVTTAPWLLQILVPGFAGAKRELALHLVRILFPGTGLLVLSALCLGVLNSHRRFFLSYVAPVGWNAAIIVAALLPAAGTPADAIVVWTAWGAVAGGFLQVAIQLPMVLKLTGGLRLTLGAGDSHVATVLRNFFPAFVGRGVIQISAFVDSILASYLGTGAVAAFANAQMLYTLPVSLFGMSVAAAELPELSAAAGAPGDAHPVLRDRLERGMRQVAYFIVPSAVAMASLGHVLAAAVFQTGAFTHANVMYVWGILAGSTIGLLASSLGRLYSSAWYALHDTRTPLRYAVIRVLLTTILGYLAALRLPGAIGVSPAWGVAGLTASAGVAGWVEYFLLRRSLDRRIGRTRLSAGFSVRLWTAALAAGAAGWGILLLVTDRLGPIPTAAAVLVPFAAVYLGASLLLGVEEAGQLVGRFSRRR